ncbi:MAG: type II toxin-antitoxin system VapC family toxin [Pyrinomonadaceae bacterium]
MILVDANALISICDKGQANHAQFARFIEQSNADLVTTLPCLTEAMYFMGKYAGWRGQEILWLFISNYSLMVHPLDSADLNRMRSLMKKYFDVPMDFADASLVRTAESIETSRILTSDSDFGVYRINGRKHFEIIP